jgi:hypothetical protein
MNVIWHDLDLFDRNADPLRFFDQQFLETVFNISN